MRSRNAPWLRRGDVTECSRCRMEGGVRHRVQFIEHLQDTEDQRDAGKAKEDLGPMMFIF